MAFDQKIINQNSIFKWDGTKRGLTVWDQNQTPYTWLKDSVIWVSQRITPILGKRTINYYLKIFNYGNQDFSGDPEKNNGLTSAWLSSSLKISGYEQIQFLKNLYFNKLTVSKEAMENTKSNMYLETSSNGWSLYGKTGTEFKPTKFIHGKNDLTGGWFVGFIKKKNQNYIFVLNFADQVSPLNDEAGGTRAKNTVKRILKDLQLY